MPLRLSAALSYDSVFSLAPLFLIAIAGAVAGDEAVRGQLDDQLKSSLGPAGAFAVQDMVANAGKPSTNVLMSAAGIVMLLVGAQALVLIWIYYIILHFGAEFTQGLANHRAEAQGEPALGGDHESTEKLPGV